MLDLEAYLRRIAYEGPRTPTLATLRALQAQHARSIPFENLDTLLKREVELDIGALEHKLVASGRGGYCFEHNTLFAHVLAALGIESTALAARVVWERPSDEVRPRTHMVLLAEVREGRYLCDVGFGGLTPTGPLALTPDIEQQTPHELFRVVTAEGELAVEALVRGQWKRLYRFDLQAQQPCDIELLNFFVMRHPDSPMAGRLLAARSEPGRRFGLMNTSLAIHHANAPSEHRELRSIGELRAVLEDCFALQVPSGEDVDAALARLLG
jgi:N-hydroxyarylamine O-acetyltransferase